MNLKQKISFATGAVVFIVTKVLTRPSDGEMRRSILRGTFNYELLIVAGIFIALHFLLKDKN